MNWQYTDRHQLIHILPPLGAKPILIEINKENMTIIINKKIISYQIKPEDILYNEIGWSIPLDSLIYWVQGLPDPKYAVKVISNNNILCFQQNDWSINLQKFHKDINLPTLILLNNGDTTIKILIKTWNN